MKDNKDNLPEPANHLPELDNKEPKFKDVTLDDIINLKVTHPQLTLIQAGKILNCSKTNICYHLHKEGMLWDSINDDITAYKNNRADILAFKGAQTLKYLTVDEIKKSSAYQKVGMYGILQTHERLERGQSTANVAYKDLSANMAELDAQIAKEEEELGITGS
ncbi:MAG: hypothetical protein GY861_02985 [bacterium]|nr:hypothetical protein [bacterium]